MYAKLTKALVWGIIIALSLLAMVVLMLEPAARSMFVQGYVDWLATAAALVVGGTLAFAALMKWS